MPRGQVKAPAKPAESRKPLWDRIVNWLLIFLDVAAVGALVLTGYAGLVSPLRFGGVWGILPLGFPIALLAVGVLALIQMFHFRKGLIILLSGIALCAGPLLTYCPLHIGDRKAAEGAETFTLLTYNVCNFDPADGSESGACPALAYILDQDADIVCIQEAAGLAPTAANRITAAQLDSLHARYPHVIVSGRAQALLSKFPVEPIHLDATVDNFGNGDIGAYRLTLPSGKLISLFNVHLFSYSLNPDDKTLYKNLTELKREPMSDVRSQLLHKLRVAAEGRAREAVQMQRWIRLYGGPESIVCGDFNDVQDCYTIRSLADTGFEDVYPRVGFGPMVTFHDDRFYFCIDHVLSRGDLRPLWLRKGRTHASDHYPLTVEFEVEKTF